MNRLLSFHRGARFCSRALLSGGACLFTPLAASAAVYTSTETPIAITDEGSIEVTVTVPDLGTVVDLNVHLDIEHPFDGDLDVFLTSPEGTLVELFSDMGAGGDNFTGTVLDDEAEMLLLTGTAPFTGSYVPEGLLSAFDGEDMGGVWTLTVTDDFADDLGTLNSFALDFRKPPCVLTTNAGTISLVCDDGTTSVPDASCTVVNNGNGTATISCDDGTSAVVPTTDSSCSVSDNGDGTATIECDDGSSAVVRTDDSGCSVTENDDGSATINCDDGSSATIEGGSGGGEDGEDGSSCSVVDNGDGTKTITCEDGTTATVTDGSTGPEGEPGADGVNGRAGVDGTDGNDGDDGTDGDNCSVEQNDDGSATISCDDGTEATVEAGQDGSDGGGCSTSPGGAGAPPIGWWAILLAIGLFVRRRLGAGN